MSELVTVERDGWFRQDSSLFGRTSQGCSTETAEMKKEGFWEKYVDTESLLGEFPYLKTGKRKCFEENILSLYRV